MFRVLLTHGVGKALWKGSLAVALLYLADRSLDPPPVARLTFALLVFAAWAWQLRRDLVVPLRRRPRPRDLAAWWERSHPELADRLATAVELSGAGPERTGSEELLAEVVRQAEAEVRGLRPAGAVPSRVAWRHFLLGAAATAVVAAFAWTHPAERDTFLERLAGADAPWPSATHLVLQPVLVEGADEPVAPEDLGRERYRLRLARGSLATLRIRAEGETPERVEAVLPDGRRSLQPVGGGEFVLRLPPLEDDLVVRFRGGDDQDGRPELRIEVGDAPAVERWRVRVTPPPYTGLRSEESDARELRVVRGSTLTVRFRADRPVASARITRLDGSEVPVQRAADDPETFVATWTADRSGEVAVDLVGPEGFLRRRAAVLRWQAEADRAPRVRIPFPRESWSTVFGGTVPLAVRAEDDFGLAGLVVVGLDGTERELTPGDPLRFEEVLELAAPEEGDGDGAAVGRRQVVVRARDRAEPEPHLTEARSPWVQTLAPEVFDRRQAERMVRLRTRVERLRHRVATANEVGDGWSPSLARSVRRELENLAADAEFEFLQRLWSGLDEGTGPHRAAIRPWLLESRPPVGFSVDALRATGAAPLFERSGLLEAILEELVHARRDVVPALVRALTAGEDPLPAAEDLREALDAVLAALVEWEDFESALNLLRDLIQRQREIYLRTQESAER